MGRNAGREKRERKVILATTAVVAAPNAVAAAGATPTKAEYDAVVLLANELKADFNNLINAMRG
jgi:hypothetical protein